MTDRIQFYLEWGCQMESTYQISVMQLHEAFHLKQRYIRFTENSKCKTKPSNESDTNFDPLSKICYILNKLMKGLWNAWTASEKISIDESMMKYCGRTIKFVQYMPKKPIKRGVKVFAVCCTFSAFLLGFEVYTGAENSLVDNSSHSDVKWLIESSGLTTVRGCIMYRDNWYTTMELATTLFTSYGWRFCRTLSLTDKKGCNGDNIPFKKLSQGALHEVTCGWFREAIIWKKTSRGKKYAIQSTTWHDKKQVLFVHTNKIG